MNRISAFSGILSLFILSQARAQIVPEPFTAHFERAMQYLRTSLRNPSSLSLIEVRAMRSNKNICITYRAQNGFGGYSVEQVAYIPRLNGMLTHDDSAFREQWNKFCPADKTVDLTPQALAEYPPKM